MTKKPIHINKWLLPFSWLYGIIVCLRNKFFRWGILKQKQYDIPVICVGNITVGGTGKTPHTEYLADLLKDEFRVAVLSRGYKRKSKGFVLATADSTSRDIGDEPLQIKRKFPDVIVAVDAKRQRGIEKLLKLDKDIRPQVILLDDAFQHRYVKPSYTILLSDYNRPMYHDKLLPAGRLRESIDHAEQANMIVVTKCPSSIKPIDLRIISHELHPYPYQSLFYTTLEYGNIVPVFGNGEEKRRDTLRNKNVLLIAGIADPKVLVKKIKGYTKKFDSIIYPDHHTFQTKDIKEIENKFRERDETIVLTTEKDAIRLRDANLSEELKDSLYYLPIKIAFIGGKETQKMFNKNIIHHVRKNSRNV